MNNLNKIDNLNLIVKMVFGSHLYGTATENSDTDYKGVYLPTEKEILLNRVPKSYNYKTGNGVTKNTKDDIDIEIFSLHYFIKLACEGQTVALDMLHAPEDMIIEKSPLWDEIIENKEFFYTRNLEAFVEYARKQAAKYGVKGSRLSAIKSVIDSLEASHQDSKLKEIWEYLPSGEHIHNDLMDEKVGLRIYQVCGRSFHETTRVSYVLPILQKVYDNYGARAKQAENNKNIAWKAVSHAIRAALQVKELLVYNTITFPLEKADYLLEVKQGQRDYLTDVSPYLESLMDEVEKLVLESTLPTQVDENYWNNFLVQAIKKYVIFKD